MMLLLTVLRAKKNKLIAYDEADVMTGQLNSLRI